MTALGVSMLLPGLLGGWSVVEYTWDMMRGRGLPQTVYFPSVGVGFTGAQFYAILCVVSSALCGGGIVLLGMRAGLPEDGESDV